MVRQVYASSFWDLDACEIVETDLRSLLPKRHEVLHVLKHLLTRHINKHIVRKLVRLISSIELAQSHVKLAQSQVYSPKWPRAVGSWNELTAQQTFHAPAGKQRAKICYVFAASEICYVFAASVRFQFVAFLVCAMFAITVVFLVTLI